MQKKLIFILPLLVVAANADAANKISATKITVDGYALKVVRYDNETVKVVKDVVIGGGANLLLRDVMRRAVEATTGCRIIDEWFADAKLFGKLDCSSSPHDGGDIK